MVSDQGAGGRAWLTLVHRERNSESLDSAGGIEFSHPTGITAIAEDPSCTERFLSAIVKIPAGALTAALAKARLKFERAAHAALSKHCAGSGYCPCETFWSCVCGFM